MKRYVCLFLGFFAVSAHAKLFRNAYISFELPPNWNCSAEGTSWVCVNQYDAKTKEATIMLTAKEAGPSDSTNIYETYLRTPHAIKASDGRMLQATVISVKQNQVAGQTWIDSMHSASEVPGYYTRYLGTVRDRVAILITFSALKTQFTKYSNDFIHAVESLRVMAPKDILDEKPMMMATRGSGTIGAPIGSSLPVDLNNDQAPPMEDSSALGQGGSKIIGIVLIVIAIAIYFLFKSRKKPKKKK